MAPSTPTSTPTRDILVAAARAELAAHGSSSVSMRAVARRAGVSHAAPAHFFGDRAGLLTAVAEEGFRMLSAELAASVAETDDGVGALTALGRAYVDFGLSHPALIDLMFRREELDSSDPALATAQADALGRLRSAVGDLDGDAAGVRALASWALAHGLVVLAREGALAAAAGREPGHSAAVARELIAVHAASLE